MINRLIVENFKGVGHRTEIDLRPITLLVGANSTGKSTLVHALHYLRALLHGRDPGGPLMAGKGGPGLGTFAELVHGHDLSKIIAIGVECEFPDEPLYPVYRQRQLIEKAIRSLSVTVAVGRVPSVHPWPSIAIRYAEIKANIVETHSEHLVKKLLERIGESTQGKALFEGSNILNANSVAIISTEKSHGDKDAELLMRRILIKDDGSPVKRWPKGFFTEM